MVHEHDRKFVHIIIKAVRGIGSLALVFIVDTPPILMFRGMGPLTLVFIVDTSPILMVRGMGPLHWSSL